MFMGAHVSFLSSCCLFVPYAPPPPAIFIQSLLGRLPAVCVCGGGGRPLYSGLRVGLVLVERPVLLLANLGLALRTAGPT